MNSPRIIYIECCDYEAHPVGGHLSFAKRMLTAFGDELALVGVTSDDTPVGRWTSVLRQGQRFHFFSVGRIHTVPLRPIIPARLRFHLQLKRYRKQILSLGLRDAIVGCPEGLLAVHNWNWDYLLHHFHGVANPLLNSRYWWSPLLAARFEKYLIASLSRVDTILASADETAVAGLIERSHGQLRRAMIHLQPTCVDTTVFRPGDKAEARTAVGLPHDAVIAVACGRLSVVKGWQLLLDALGVWIQDVPNGILCFVGDGEDRRALESEVRDRNLGAQVRVEGFKTEQEVARYLQASDLVVLASLSEGWPTCLVEAIACGKPIVSTAVSGAEVIVNFARNGRVLPDRDPVAFARAMRNVLQVHSPATKAAEVDQRFGIAAMTAALRKVCPPLAF